MKKYFVFFIIVFLMSCTPKSAEVKEKMLLDDFLWLVGSWQNSTEDHLFTETWVKKNDSILSGSSYMLNGKDTLFIEQISIICRAGAVFYVAKVENQNEKKAIEFKLISSTAEKFVFENKNHDFPQQIVYTHPKPDSLVAWIQGNSEGRFQKEEFKMRRVK